MKKSAKLMVVLLAAIFVGTIGYGIAYPTRIPTYSGASHTGCHGTNDPGSGTMSVTTSVSGRVINLTVTITGFTEAVAGDSHGTVSIGIPYGYGDNAEFGHGMLENNIHGDDNFWATNLWEENLTAGGDTMHPYKFQILAPAAAGSYDLKVVALTGWNGTSDAEAPLYRLEQTLTVTVSGNTATIASLAMAVPFGNLYGILLIGVIALGAMFLILVRKRK